MRALGKLKKEKGIWLYDAPMPEIGPNDLLIKVSKTGICGTDMHIYNWDAWAQQTIPVPITTGHEFVGMVERVGELVEGFKPGERVSGECHISCGICRNCRGGKRHLCRNTRNIAVTGPGCFADYFVLPAFNAFHVPDDISDEIGAILDPFGNAAHTALSFDLVGEDVLIAGAGPVGLMAAAICRHVGARHVVITDVNEARLALAEKLGITRAVNVAKTSVKDVMQDLGMTEGFDVGLEVSGNPQAISDMLDTMNCGGKIALLGIPPENVEVDWNKIVIKGLFLKGIYGREMFETWYRMTSMLQSGLDLKPVITHEFAADEFQEAFDVMGSGQSGKILLHWN